jgi:hypothetical protein
MNNPLVPEIGFILLTLVSYYYLMRLLRSTLKKSTLDNSRQRKILNMVIIGLLAWGTFISIMAKTGFFSDFTSIPPRLGIILFIPLITILLITFSKTANVLLPLIPPAELIKIQVFRVVVEIILWVFFIQHLLPVQMTFEGRNFDILVGLTAPIMVFLINRYSLAKKWIIVWNIAGILILFNIVGIALLSAPTPFRYFMNEPANTIVATFPFIWLPGFLVPLAYGLHFLSLRQLTIKQQ